MPTTPAGARARPAMMISARRRFAWEGSNEKPDHSRFNLAYWQHYDRVIEALHQRGMIAHVMIKVYNKMVNWPAKGSAEDDLFFRWLIARYAAYPNVHLGFFQGSEQREGPRLQARPAEVPPRQRSVPPADHGARRPRDVRSRRLRRLAGLPLRPAALQLARDDPGAPPAARLAGGQRRVRL